MQTELFPIRNYIETHKTNIHSRPKTILTVAGGKDYNDYQFTYFAVIELLHCNSVSNSIDIMQTSRVKLPRYLTAVTFDPNTNITSTNNNILLAVGCMRGYFILFNVEIIDYQQFKVTQLNQIKL